MVERDHLKNEWDNNAQGRPVDQNLVKGKPEDAGDL
jgi:hypothetical protein